MLFLLFPILTVYSQAPTSQYCSTLNNVITFLYQAFITSPFSVSIGFAYHVTLRHTTGYSVHTGWPHLLTGSIGCVASHFSHMASLAGDKLLWD